MHLHRCLLAAALCACGRAEKPAPPRAANPLILTYAAMSAAFDSARPPTTVDLTGVWVEVSSIATLQFLEGRDGPDRVRFDSTGLKIDDGPRKPFSWTLTFARTGSATYNLTERMGGQVHEPLGVRLIDSTKSFNFDPDFGSDEGITYACRVVRAGRAICFDLHHDGSGSEFRQISMTVPPPPPPFCPLTDLTECAGSKTGISARQILADARVCYHLLYPLVHRPDGAGGTDTWLVLGGDSLPPIGAWQYAAVFDDSIVRVGAWQRTRHTPALPKNAHPE